MKRIPLSVTYHHRVEQSTGVSVYPWSERREILVVGYDVTDYLGKEREGIVLEMFSKEFGLYELDRDAARRLRNFLNNVLGEENE